MTPSPAWKPERGQATLSHKSKLHHSQKYRKEQTHRGNDGPAQRSLSEKRGGERETEAVVLSILTGKTDMDYNIIQIHHKQNNIFHFSKCSFSRVTSPEKRIQKA